VQEYECTIKTANEEFASKEKQLSAELASTKKAADKVSTELESTKGKLEKSTAKGKELSDEVKEVKGQLSQSQKEHDAAVKAGNALSQQLESLRGEYAAKVQEYECTIKTANEEFASKEKQLSAELASTKKAADKVSTELESTKGKLEKSTAKGKEFVDEINRLECRRVEIEVQCKEFEVRFDKLSSDHDSLKSQMVLKQRDHDAAMQAVHDDVAVHIESGIRAAQKLFSSDLASSKKSVEKLSSDLKIALARAEGAEQTLASLRSDMRPKISATLAPVDAVQEPQANCCTVSSAKIEKAAAAAVNTADIAKSAETAVVAAPESRRRVLECAPALIVDGPVERPKRRPLSAVDANAVAISQPSKVGKNDLFSYLSVL
jgi:chromosome segregation ATPase